MKKYLGKITNIPHKIFGKITDLLERRAFTAKPYVLSNEKFYQGLNLDLSDLSDVKDAVQFKDYQLAAERFKEYLSFRKKPTFFYILEEREFISKKIKEKFPVSFRKTINKAEKICNHIFNVLGTGEVALGEKVNWFTNFKDNSWEQGYYKDLIERIFKNDFQNEFYIGDIKLPWELNKHLHFVDLGKAFYLTGDEKYAQEFFNQTESWIKQNPYKIGVNWITTIVVSQRVISWIFALFLFINSKNLTSKKVIKILKQIWLHGEFIYNNLEYAPRASNHLIGNASALFMIAYIFPEFKSSKLWLKKSLKILVEQAKIQIYGDGVQYEQSTSYQRYVLEFLLLVVLLKYVNKDADIKELIDKFKIEKMLEYLKYITQPDGLVQPISDADGARAWNFNNVHINDHRSYLSLGAVIFNRCDFKYSAGDNFEEIIWFLDKDGFERYENIEAKPQGDTSKPFFDGGYFVMRDLWSDYANWLFFDCGHIGMGSWPKGKEVGTHGHSDTLNLGLFSAGETFITDTGSYTYTGSKKWHDYFRSSKAHNVVLVDDQDECILTKTWATKFRPDPEGVKWISKPEYDYVRGSHNGFLKLKDPVFATREILFLKEEKIIIIRDTLKGTKLHKVDLYFHLHPQIKAVKNQDNSLKLQGSKHAIYLKVFSEKMKLSILHGKEAPLGGWYSEDYGKKTPVFTLNFSQNIQLPAEIFTCINLKDENMPAFEEVESKIRNYVI